MAFISVPLSLEDVKIPINKTRLKIAVLKWQPGLPGSNELRNHKKVNHKLPFHWFLWFTGITTQDCSVTVRTHQHLTSEIIYIKDIGQLGNSHFWDITVDCQPRYILMEHIFDRLHWDDKMLDSNLEEFITMMDWAGTNGWIDEQTETCDDNNTVAERQEATARISSSCTWLT